ncbi:hypothetical protein OBBRIDRAFT_802149 [Obba rivulosa]|uniref:Uncharacterized protein n=1 Tax=Obba rivulosa TaxID=1052685 RepID=A0A8E2DNJ3_9APHY|nr:hypothetical protein OBBRIDRAFT_802149 [Obba rivulosa]
MTSIGSLASCTAASASVQHTAAASATAASAAVAPVAIAVDATAAAAHLNHLEAVIGATLSNTVAEGALATLCSSLSLTNRITTLEHALPLRAGSRIADPALLDRVEWLEQILTSTSEMQVMLIPALLASFATFPYSGSATSVFPRNYSKLLPAGFSSALVFVGCSMLAECRPKHIDGLIEAAPGNRDRELITDVDICPSTLQKKCLIFWSQVALMHYALTLHAHLIDMATHVDAGCPLTLPLLPKVVTMLSTLNSLDRGEEFEGNAEDKKE